MSFEDIIEAIEDAVKRIDYIMIADNITEVQRYELRSVSDHLKSVALLPPGPPCQRCGGSGIEP